MLVFFSPHNDVNAMPFDLKSEMAPKNKIWKETYLRIFVNNLSSCTMFEDVKTFIIIIFTRSVSKFAFFFTC